MKRIGLILLAGTLAAWNASAGTPQASKDAQTPPPSGKHGAAAQASGSGSSSTSAQAGKSSASIASGTTADAVLTSAVDARHNKVGDHVTARTTKDVTS